MRFRSLLLLPLILTVNIHLFSSEPLRLEVPPGGWRLVEEAAPHLPPTVNLAIRRAPRWLREALYWKMVELSMLKLKLNGQVSATLFDVNGDGLKDLTVGTSDGLVKFFINIGSRFHPVFSGINTYIPPEIDVVDRAVPFAGDVDGDGDQDLVLGNSRGQVILFENQGLKGGFVRFREKQDYFQVKVPKEKRKKGGKEYSIIDVGKNSVPFLFDWDGDGDLDLIVGSGDGKVRLFLNQGSKTSPIWKEVKENSPFQEIRVSKDAAPIIYHSYLQGKEILTLLVFDGSGEAAGYFFKNKKWVPSGLVASLLRPWPPEAGGVIPSVVDINEDGFEDALLGTAAGTVHLIKNISFKNGSSKGPQQPSLVAGSEWLGGYDLIRGGTRPLTFVKVFNPRYAVEYSRLILSTEKRLVDEVGFVIAHTATQVLRVMVDGPQDKEGISYTPRVFRENARWIYRISRALPYAKLVENRDHTTLSLMLSDGRWHKLPPEIYYWYVVHPRLRFEAPSHYLGTFWREFFFKDRKYGTTAVEAVQGAQNVRQAVEKLCRWSRKFVEWGEESHDKLPREPYYANYGSCGEWSIFATALGRALLIPTRLANDWGEDHVWNEFYEAGGWHRWDLNFPPETSLDRPGIYEAQWKKTVSTVWTIRGDDYIVPISEKYTGLAKVKLKLTDPGGEPVAGALVIVMSFWAVEKKYDKVPLLSIWGVSDEEGKVEFLLGENRYKFVVFPPQGKLKEVILEDPQGRNKHIREEKTYSLHVILDSTPGEPKYRVPEVSPEPGRLKQWKVEALSSFLRVRVPLKYPAKYHYITGNEYTVPSKGKLFYFVCEEKEFRNFLKGKPFKALAYGELKGKIAVPRRGILVLWNKTRATWFRVSLR